MEVPFVNLARQFSNLKPQLIDIFSKIGESGNYILGDRLKSFEKKISKYCDVSNAVGVANGSEALFLILKALDVKKNDEVIVPTNSFIASAWVVKALGASLRFVDVDDTLNIDPSSIEQSINSKTKVIMAVHFTGRSAAMDEINKIASSHNNIYVIEDAAQAIGASYKNKKVGSLAKAAGFSLHPVKNLSVYGDGGFGLTGFDVESYVRFDLPIVSIVGNNGAWNQTTQGVVKRGGRALGTYLSQDTDYAKIMEGMGGHSERVSEPDQIKPALERAFESGKPALVDVVIDQNVSYGTMGGRSREQRQY